MTFYEKPSIQVIKFESKDIVVNLSSSTDFNAEIDYE